MNFILSLLLGTPRFILPTGWDGWAGFGLYGVLLLAWLIWAKRDEDNQREKNPILGIIRLPEPFRKFTLTRTLFFILLLIITPAASSFLGIRLPSWDALPMPGIAIATPGNALMVFSALPWVFAAGLLGPFSAIILGLFSGLILGYWGTYSPLTAVETAILAGLFAFLVRQRYRTWVFRLLRQPVIAALLLGLFYPFLFTVDSLILGRGPFVSRLDYAFSSFDSATAAICGALFIASIFAQIIKWRLPELWGARKPWLPAPMETSLEKRFVFYMIPLAVTLIVTLMIADWLVTGRAARQMIVDRMKGIARVASVGIPNFMDTGQSLITQFSRDSRLVLQNPKQMKHVLAGDLRSVPFFRALFIANQDYEIIGGYPDDYVNGIEITLEEQSGIDFAYQGGAVSQVYTIPPALKKQVAQVTFLSAIFDKNGKTVGVLIGRVDLLENTFALPIIDSMQDIREMNGTGMILDEFGRIIYHTGGLRIMEPYDGELFDTATHLETKAHDGTRSILYYQPVYGRPWSVVLSVPARQAQDLAVQVASPLLVMSIFLVLLGVLVLHWGLGKVTSALGRLIREADSIAAGDLTQPMSISGHDEIGQLTRSFEKMRKNLKTRIDDSNLLLDISRSIASSVEMCDAVTPILEAVLSMGANSARIVLEPDIIPKPGMNHETQIRFGRGKDPDLYGYLDGQILDLTREQDRVFLTDPARASFLTFGLGTTPPKSLFALALKHEKRNYGALWVVYDKPHKYSESEIRFLTTLAEQAALAAANMCQYLTAETGRQHIASILDSIEDPILVTDQDDNLVLVNPAAATILLEADADDVIGKPAKECIPQHELLSLLLEENDKPANAIEVYLKDGRVFIASVSRIYMKDRKIGKVCVSRDVTRFKELDALKSDFVSTVSHDLRNPLTLIRGYATMMAMVGDLNEQQTSYNEKIILGVERMFRLVDNLLDLGRIEAKVGLQIEPVRIEDIIGRVTKSLGPQALQKRIEIIPEIDDEETQEIDADPALLQQALYNLLDNAIRYSALDSKVWIRAIRKEDAMIFEVEDKGIGISPVDQPRVFDKFYQVEHGENQRERGTGLGLAIVKAIAERHGGRVALKSQLGKGSIFYLALPIHQEEGTIVPPITE